MSRSHRHGRRRHLGEGEPPPLFKKCRRATHDGTIAPMFTNHPVNRDHFKRSPPQCVYLTNIKFTCENEGRRRIDAAVRERTHDTSLPSCFIFFPPFLRFLFAAPVTQIPSFCAAVADPRVVQRRGSCKLVVSS